MKKEDIYEKLIMQTIIFESEDVIIASDPEDTYNGEKP
jgi:hypothetical protein